METAIHCKLSESWVQVAPLWAPLLDTMYAVQHAQSSLLQGEKNVGTHLNTGLQVYFFL